MAEAVLTIFPLVELAARTSLEVIRFLSTVHEAYQIQSIRNDVESIYAVVHSLHTSLCTEQVKNVVQGESDIRLMLDTLRSPHSELPRGLSEGQGKAGTLFPDTGDG
jgi:uncharacterized LabA/DUF88 family protein